MIDSPFPTFKEVSDKTSSNKAYDLPENPSGQNHAR